MCTPSKIAWVLVIIGGLTWGLVGIGALVHQNWDIVNLIFGGSPTLEAIIYILVGVSTVSVMIGCKCKKCRECMAHGHASHHKDGAEM